MHARLGQMFGLKMDIEELHWYCAVLMILSALPTFLTLVFGPTAPYGRYVDHSLRVCKFEGTKFYLKQVRNLQSLQSHAASGLRVGKREVGP